MTADRKELSEVGWRPRLAALADAQSRYFYLLGAAGVFFLALLVGLEPQGRIGTGSALGAGSLLHVRISTALVLATGPIVLGFLIQAVTGTILAIDSAAWRMAVLEEVEFEKEHTAPSAVDLAFYTNERSPALARAGRLLVYPVYLTLFLAEGGGLSCWLWRTEFEQGLPGFPYLKWLLFGLGVALLVTALPRLLSMWWRKLSHAWVLLRHKNTPVGVSRAMTVLADISDSLRGAGRKVESRFEKRWYRFYVDDDLIAWGRSLQELTVRTREWADSRADQVVEEGQQGALDGRS